MLLVINYKPLNFFLQEDESPLPNKQFFFANLASTKNLSKFDLKVGFWQLKVRLDDRYKIAFSLLGHYN